MSEDTIPVGSTGKSLRSEDRGVRGLDEYVVVSDKTNPDRALTVNADGSINVGNFPATQPVSFAEPVAVTGDFSDTTGKDVFGNGVSSPRYNQIEVDFSVTDPDANTDVAVTKTGTGDASNITGHAKFETGTSTTGAILCTSVLTIDYRPSHEIYAAFTAAFTTGVANSFQRIGLYGTTDGFFIGYEGAGFGLTARFNSADTRVAQASFSEDTLTGGAGSLFTRAGAPEALDPTKSNLYRIRFGWFGSAPISFEVFSPDGAWVVFHKIAFPNSQLNPSLATTLLSVRLHAAKTAGATNLVMYSGCWAAGTTSALQTLTATLTDRTLAQTVRAVLTGRTTAGGSAYVNVKVNPSGALVADASGSTVTAVDSGEREYTHVPFTVTAIGDTTIYTPASGKAVRLRKIIAINDPLAASSTMIKVKLGAVEIWRVWALSSRQVKTGPVDGALIINLSAAGNVAVTALLEEV